MLRSATHLSNFQRHRWFLPPSAVPSIANALDKQQSSQPSLPAPHSSLYDPSFSSSPFCFQIRWRRRHGVSQFYKPRPPTKKQRKKFHRERRRKEWELHGRHSAPGSVAGKRREHEAKWLEEYLNWNKNQEQQEEQLEYGYGDALLDDLMGNTAEYTSTPTPKPKYLGHQHSYYYTRVANQMAKYRELREQQERNSNDQSETSLLESTILPSDHDISLVVRSYRDRQGKRSNPIGIAKALQHVLKDLKLPTSLFGEETYTSLLTCCRTPKEAQRIFQLMRDQEMPPTAYCWSILVDIHAKLADYEGADRVIKEMVLHGHQPTLAAYTSLLAACYKVCDDGRVPHAIRARAGTLAWEKWKELQIIGLEPDVMCYGAILRVCAARGHAERALNLLDQMPISEPPVKPTTLCFTSALKAVAQSHQIAKRFQNGASRRDRRREKIAAHHGNMARQIVIGAENTEVEQDEGFIAALLLCAGAAGDSATAKAVVLAHQIRKLDHFRTIGSDEHLRRLRGMAHETNKTEMLSFNEENAKQLGESKTNKRLMSNLQDGDNEEEESFQEREYGPENRIVSSLLLACAQSMEGMGTIWEGRENKGYLCANSLRMIQVRPTPEYKDNSIPGVSTRHVGLGSIGWEDEEPDKLSKRLRRKKFEGVDMEEEGTDMDTIDNYYYNLFRDDDPALTKEDKDHAIHREIKELKRLKASRKASKDLIPAISGLNDAANKNEDDDDNHNDDDDFDFDFMNGTDGGLSGRQFVLKAETGQIEEIVTTPQPVVEEPSEEWYFDQDAMKWKTRPYVPKVKAVHAAKTVDTVQGNDKSQSSSSSGEDENGPEEDEEEYYFDDDDMRWKTRPKKTQPVLTEYEASIMANKQMVQFDSQNKNLEYLDVKASSLSPTGNLSFEHFVEELRNEIRESGEEPDFTEEEARELFAMVSQEYEQQQQQESVIDGTPAESANAGLSIAENSSVQNNDELVGDEDGDHDNYDEMMSMMKELEMNNDEIGALTGSNEVSGASKEAEEKMMRMISDSVNDNDHDEHNDNSIEEKMNASTSLPELEGSETEDPNLILKRMVEEAEREFNGLSADGDDNEKNSLAAVAEEKKLNPKLAELQELLPGMPVSRLQKILQEFEGNLGYPSLLTLTTLLRENMPESLTNGWLKQKNVQNAYFAIQTAKQESQDGRLSLPILNGILRVETASGNVDRSLSCHVSQFRLNGQTPTQYSDRLVWEMLIKNHRVSRALVFKEKVVEAEGRTLDILSYGTIIDHYSKHGQIGSAMMMLKECIRIHKSPPNERSLSRLRLLCRQQKLTDLVGLGELAGPDPYEWLRDGEKNKKRESSKKGKRSVLLAINKSVHA